ncbi:hypothetical protein [Synechococcus sp. RS9902]|uniref:hypothetical protein n=1 Tax=Synechococcus sp. RS9902 TaxID=221345 RepID=UPI0016444921|nr:hypothetical protein [Synechococcus sp. RS9902]QNI98353.1 hypothetical protein SynRS9902_02480 [Synechococcus sp. RS9902]
MLSSPFQQPSPRQNALAQQIQEARTSGDQALLAGLISQWVHRYGFDGAAELDLSLPEPSASKHGFSSVPIPVAEEEIAPEDEISPEDDVLVDNEVVAEDEVVVQDEVVVEEEEQIAAEDDVLIESEVMPNGVVAEEETIVEEDESAAEEKPLQRSFASVPVPAPPISTPRSLRRWLPRREDDAFPKAS